MRASVGVTTGTEATATEKATAKAMTAATAPTLGKLREGWGHLKG
jgi:hypothetical protein